MLYDLGHLVAHLLLLLRLDVRHLLHAVDADTRAENLDLVRVHRRVRDEDARVFNALGLPDANALVQNKTVLEVRVLRRREGERGGAAGGVTCGVCRASAFEEETWGVQVRAVGQSGRMVLA